jgi:DNA replication protein DnaC
MPKNDTMNKLKEMRLNGWIESWDKYMEMAKQPKCSLENLVTTMIDEEYAYKQERALMRRIAKAKIEEEWCIETYPFKLQPKLNTRKLMSCYDSLTYMEANRNLVWVGPTGCGKTGLATSFLLHALRSGYTGRYVTFHTLVHELFQAAADHTEQKKTKTICHV